LLLVFHFWQPNHRMEADRGANRPPKGILAPKMVASPEIGSGLVPRRLMRSVGMSERFWINLQTRYDLEVEKDRLQDRLEKEVHAYAVAV
jgi:hypothetical protein